VFFLQHQWSFSFQLWDLNATQNLIKVGADCFSFQLWDLNDIWYSIKMYKESLVLVSNYGI